MSKHYKHKKKLVEKLRALKYDLDSYDESGYALIHYVAANGLVDCIDAFCMLGADLERVSYVRSASFNEFVETVKRGGRRME